MNLCASCGYQLPVGYALCPHHHTTDTGWARTNRVMCDLLHRGIAPLRLRARDREDEMIGRVQPAAA
jgi:hypothetical protein